MILVKVIRVKPTGAYIVTETPEGSGRDTLLRIFPHPIFRSQVVKFADAYVTARPDTHKRG